MNTVHIQGTCVSSIRIGAYYNDRLVAVMGFRKNRSIFKSSGWELLRFACIGNIPRIIKQHRFDFTKNKLVKLGYDNNLSENQIMSDRKYYKIWDAGNRKFIWKA